MSKCVSSVYALTLRIGGSLCTLDPRTGDVILTHSLSNATLFDVFDWQRALKISAKIRSDTGQLVNLCVIGGLVALDEDVSPHALEQALFGSTPE